MATTSRRVFLKHAATTGLTRYGNTIAKTNGNSS